MARRTRNAAAQAPKEPKAIDCKMVEKKFRVFHNTAIRMGMRLSSKVPEVGAALDTLYGMPLEIAEIMQLFEDGVIEFNAQAQARYVAAKEQWDKDHS